MIGEKAANMIVVVMEVQDGQLKVGTRVQDIKVLTQGENRVRKNVIVHL